VSERLPSPSGDEAVTHHSVAPPIVRWIDVVDVVSALQRGLEDFRAVPTPGILFGLTYCVAGHLLARAVFDAALAPLVFPLVAGFALLAPVFAIGLYELSRRREEGLPTRWWHVLGVRRHASPLAILALGAFLALLFVAWLAAAAALYQAIMETPPASLAAFVREILTTNAGWTLILAGHVVGAVFAVTVFMVSAVSFPLLVDREIGAIGAVRTSVRAVLANPLPMGAWAGLLAGALILGCAPLLLGLPVVLPVLGHSTWHIYRRVVLA